MIDRSELHIYLHLDTGKSNDDTTGLKLDRIVAQLTLLKETIMAIDQATQAKIDALLTAVSNESTIEQSVETLLQGLAAQVAALKNSQTDPAVLAALDQATQIINANNDKFSAAVVANTPADESNPIPPNPNPPAPENPQS